MSGFVNAIPIIPGVSVSIHDEMSAGNRPLMIALEAGGIIEEPVYRRFLLKLLEAYQIAGGPMAAFEAGAWNLGIAAGRRHLIPLGKESLK